MSNDPNAPQPPGSGGYYHQPPPPPGSGGYGQQPPPPPVPYGRRPGPTTTLPLISLILGILSCICLGFIAGIAAIITGIIGRKRAIEAGGQGAGMALAGIILGIIGTVLSVILTIAIVGGGLALFGIGREHVRTVDELQKATTAAEQYRSETGSYSGLTAAELQRHGYAPSSDITVRPVPQAGGADICIEGYPNSEPDLIVHVPGNQVTLDIDGRTYRYDLGACPTS